MLTPTLSSKQRLGSDSTPATGRLTSGPNTCMYNQVCSSSFRALNVYNYISSIIFFILASQNYCIPIS